MKKILIANRGEIALRIIRSARDCAIQSVAIYADDDIDAPFVRFADEAYALKGNTPTDTYLNIEKILDIAKKAKVDAVHPGYGFLSERADFAKAVLDAGLLWIGPKPEVIEQLGDKVQARHIAQSVGAPLVAGTPGPVNSAQEVIEFTKQYGFPIAIKAAYGGGGRGLKVVREANEVVNAFESAVREAVAAFGRGECYVEQFLDRPRHVEAQVIADQHGNVIVLGTRDCSLQRRNQKLVEEAPAPFLSEEQRKEIHDAAEAICKKAGYTGAGTVEFLLGSNGVISFLEVNTRLQVEHPVTEETSGIDLVAEQFRIAEGKELSIKSAPEPRGHSIEFRINAEDAGRGFLPSPGLITCFEPPSGPGIRIDSGVVAGSAIAPMFDSMMAKLIVTGKDRHQAICRARRALKEFKIEGVASVLNFHQAVIENEDFTAENGFKVHTRWIETDFDNQLQMLARSEPIKTDMQRCMIEIDGKRMELGLPAAFFRQMGNTSSNENSQEEKKVSHSKNDILAPVPGVIRVWNVKSGDSVKEGDTLGLMEAMKMETAILAPLSGIINITIEAGATASPDTIIATVKE